MQALFVVVLFCTLSVRSDCVRVFTVCSCTIASSASTIPSFIVYSERLADDLWVAVYDDDIHRVRTLLQQGANLSHPLYWREEWFNREYGSLAYRFPPLHSACQNGNLDIVKLLVQSGAGVDVGDGTDNSTPLHLACEEGQKEVAVYLIREAGCKTGEFCNVKIRGLYYHFSDVATNSILFSGQPVLFPR